MNRTTFLRTSLLALTVTLFSGCAMHAHGDRPGHDSGMAPSVVFQVSDNDPAKWNLALNNAKNVQNSMGADKVKVEIVAFGPGINMLKADSVTAARVTEASKAGVQVVACQNTMQAQKLTEADMNSSVGYVPSGVVEIMTQQRRGASYIRP